MPFTDADPLLAVLAARDPETIVGPLLWLLTRMARIRGDDTAGGELKHALATHLVALAAHPAVSYDLRLAAGGLAIEYRPHGAMG